MPVPSTMCIGELQKEAFNILPGMVNAREGAALAHASGISNDIPVTGRSQCLKMNWPKKPHGCHIAIHVMCTLLWTLGGIYIYPQRIS